MPTYSANQPVQPKPRKQHPFLLQGVARVASLLIPLALLSACGGGGTPDPLRSYKEQTLSWKSCDDTILALTDMYSPGLEPRLQCTQVQVPLDYANPASGQLLIDVLRVKAATPAVGSHVRPEPMFFNPGGPGGNGLYFAAFKAFEWTDVAQGMGSGTAQTQQLFGQLLQSFDLIGFSPRGTGDSAPYQCRSDQLLAPLDNSLNGRNPANIQAELRNFELEAQACAQNPLTPFIHTEATARDMELMREVLGGNKLNFHGASYGSWLGLWYASMFPDKVGRMLLDSNMDFTRNFSVAALETIRSQDRTFKEVIAPYAASRPDLFSLGSDAQVIRELPWTLPVNVRGSMARVVSEYLINSRYATHAALALQVGKQLSQAPFVELWPTGTTGSADTTDENLSRLDHLIGAHQFTSQTDTNVMAQAIARQMVAKTAGDLKSRKVALSRSSSVYIGVVCNDVASDSDDPLWWSNKYTSVYQTYALADLSEVRSCLYWSRLAQVVKPSLSAMKNVDVLFVQSQYDVPTPHEGADANLRQLPKSHLVFVTNEYSHGVFPYFDQCVDSHVASYLLGTSPNQQRTTCTGRTVAESLANANQKSTQSDRLMKSLPMK